jgi:beta-lactam-binding protein with PASTA domain
MQVGKFVKLPLYISALIILGLLFGYITFKIMSFSRTVEVPDIQGKSPLEANRLLANRGLYLKIEGEDYDAAVSPGNILRQDIPAGNKIRERRGIKVIISKGPRVKSVPMLVNETLLNAESLLLQKGLKITRIIMVHSDIVEKDRIIGQKPDPDEQVSDHIHVIVSLGPYEKIYSCPDFKGMLLEEAVELIRKLSLKALTEGMGEKIESQKPEAGRPVKTGDTIYLKLS